MKWKDTAVPRRPQHITHRDGMSLIPQQTAWFLVLACMPIYIDCVNANLCIIAALIDTCIVFTDIKIQKCTDCLKHFILQLEWLPQNTSNRVLEKFEK